jgi:hypothetical protein
MTQRLGQTALVMFLIADATLLLLFGRRWIRFTRFGQPSGAYYQLMTWFLKWPDVALRLLGTFEAVLGLKLFRRWAP